MADILPPVYAAKHYSVARLRSCCIRRSTPGSSCQVPGLLTVDPVPGTRLVANKGSPFNCLELLRASCHGGLCLPADV